MKLQLNEKTTKRLMTEIPSEGYVLHWDSEVKGFGLRITSSGASSYVLRYRVHGRQRIATIGAATEWTALQARDEAIALKKNIRDGEDPLKEKQAQQQANSNQPLLEDLIADYLQSDGFLKRRPTTQKEYRRMLETVIRPRLGRMQLVAIQERDIALLHAAYREKPYAGNRILALLSIVFRHGIKQKWITENPAQGIERYGEEKRERWLSEAEYQRLEQALAEYPDQNVVTCLRLITYTGSRRNEALHADWSQFNLARATWTKPSHATKQRRTEHVPLSEPAVELLRSLGPQPQGRLFAIATLQRPWERITKAAGLPALRIHDMRHHFASILASNNVSLAIVGRLLGHRNLSATQRYAHLSDDSLRTATNQFAEKVVSIERKKKSA